MASHSGNAFLVLLFLACAFQASLLADPSGAVAYELRPGSTITDECLFCDRMPIVRSLSGTFFLAPAVGGSRTLYDLLAIDFTDPDGEYAVSGSGSSTRTGTQPPSDELKLEVAIQTAQGVQLASGAVKAALDCWPAFDQEVAEGTNPARDPAHVFRMHLVAAPRTDYVLYQLVTDGVNGSYLIHECLPCARPTVPIPLGGTFLLGKIDENTLLATWRIEAIDFQGKMGDQDWKVSGAGCLTQGGEIALLQNMDLETTINQTAGVLLSSGHGTISAGFPDLEIFLTGKDPAGAVYEYDLRIVASPVQPGGTRFRRGDSNDDGQVDISDPINILLWRFNGGAAPGCQEAADSNGDGGIDIADAVYLLGYLFLEGAVPPSPGPESCGLPPKPALGCASYGSCKP